MLEVSGLFVYPIKSLGGISVPSTKVTDRGFQHDRRWMLVNSSNCFLTQRELPQMALLQVQLTDAGLTVQHKHNNGQAINIPIFVEPVKTIAVQIWSDTCKAELINPTIDEWFSDMLSLHCRLVHMPDSSRRGVDTRFVSDNQITSFSDGYPFLIIGQSSLDDLNTRLPDPLPMNRFRPNIVFTGGEPFLEDEMELFNISNIQFRGVKLSERCVIPTIDQDNASWGKEPLKTLAGFRQKNNKIYFGQNLVHKGEGEVSVGDSITVHQLKASMLLK